MNAAFARAWLAVGPVMMRNMRMSISLAVIIFHPCCIASPAMKSDIPAVSMSPAACSLAQKSGSLMIPNAPTNRKNADAIKHMYVITSMVALTKFSILHYIFFIFVWVITESIISEEFEYGDSSHEIDESV